MLNLLLHSFSIGSEAIARNKLRSLLTSLGIIFGVASVITMLSIGKGAEQQILEDMKVLGTHNLIIESVFDENPEEEVVKDPNAKNDPAKEETRKYSPGLSMKDAEGIRSIIPHLTAVTPETEMKAEVLADGRKGSVNLIGTGKDYPITGSLNTETGNFFSTLQLENAATVCIIGAGVKRKFFPSGNAVGQDLKCGKTWLRVIGVAGEKGLNADRIRDLGIRNYDLDIYIPLKTFLLRYRDRSRPIVMELVDWDEEQPEVKPKNPHQLERITLQANETMVIPEIAAVVEKFLQRRHNGVKDFDVKVPLLLLKQKEKTQEIFSYVLISIAAISLIVGGIGIMNIMLASVLERTREIGIRLSVGATKRDIVLQFLSEAITLSVGGGIIGIIFGFLFSFIVQKITGIPTVITMLPVLLAFVVSASVGLLFGWYPANKAAQQNPVESLRYE